MSLTPSSPHPSPLALDWLTNLYHFANKPDQNLGQSAPGPALHRITKGSAEAVFAEFARIDQRSFGMTRAFVDLGCGRGLVCASALVHVPKLTRLICWDIDAQEIKWAREHVASAVGTELLGQVRVAFEVANAKEFCAARDIRSALYEHDPGYPDGLSANESVWIYAFWKDWGEATRLAIAKHLFYEDGYHWSVFACSDPNLLTMLATGRHGEAFDERKLEFLHENYRRIDHPVSVALSGSKERHNIYFYVKRN